MKTIQVEVDDALLEAIKQDKDFKAMDVSTFFQGAARFFKMENGI